MLAFIYFFTILSYFWNLALCHEDKTITKCCPENQVLDAWHQCINLPPNLSAKHINITCSSLCPVQMGQGIKCPLKLRSEVHFKGHLETPSPGSCVDWSLWTTTSGTTVLEGPIEVKCQIPVEKQSGFVRKCCPIGQVLNFSRNKCVPKAIKTFLSPRMIRDEDSRLPSNNYHLELLKLQQGGVCPIGN